MDSREPRTKDPLVIALVYMGNWNEVSIQDELLLLSFTFIFNNNDSLKIFNTVQIYF